jgi:hypothetical protein
MALGTPNTIMLIGDEGLRDERYAAAATIKPGHFLVMDSNGKWKKNDLASGADAQLVVALEDYLQGKTILDAYAANDVVMAYKPLKGHKLYVRLAGGSAAVVLGDRLQLDNTGCLIKLAAGKPVAQVEEAVTPDAVNETFCRITIL